MGSIFEKSGCDALGYVIDDLLSVENALNITIVAYLEDVNCWGREFLVVASLGKMVTWIVLFLLLTKCLKIHQVLLASTCSGQ